MENLILIAGLGSDAAVWERTIHALGDKAHCIVGDTLSDDSLDGMAKRILDEAPERFTLAGVSMGGMVAMEIMRTAPQRVRSLALFDTKARPDTDEQAARRRAINAAVLAAGDGYEAMAVGSLAMLVHPDAAEDIRSAIVEMSLRVGAQTYVRQNLAAMRRSDLRQVLPTIDVPTIVVTGAQDAMTPLEHATEIHHAIAGSELHIIEMCGHLPPIERPDIVAGLLLGLIAKID